jgi:hypothetical protein
MIIHDFDVVSVSIPPCETNPELIVDPNTVLAPAISFKRFQPETWEPEMFKRDRCIQQFPQDARRLFNRLKSSAKLPVQKPEDIFVPAGSDHTDIILRESYDANQCSRLVIMWSGYGEGTRVHIHRQYTHLSRLVADHERI